MFIDINILHDVVPVKRIFKCVIMYKCDYNIPSQSTFYEIELLFPALSNKCYIPPHYIAESEIHCFIVYVH